MTRDDRRLVLVVDPDQRFVDETRTALQAHRTLAASDLAEAREIVLGGRVDVLLIGPAFASEDSLREAAGLRREAPQLDIVLAADIVTNRLLRVALRARLSDVIDIPVRVEEMPCLERSTDPASTVGPEIEFVIEPADDRAGPPIVSALHPSQYEPESVETRGSDIGWPRTLHPVAEPPDPSTERPRLAGGGR